MVKKEFIDKLSSMTGMTKKDTNLFLEKYHELIMQTLATREDVKFVGFGSYITKDRAERIGRNPRNGEEFKIEKSVAIVFKAGKEFKEIVNG